MSLDTAWSDILKKRKQLEIDDCNLGEVQQIGTDFIVTEKGMINKKRYCIPRILLQVSMDVQSILE